MSIEPKDQAAVETRLWNEIETHNTGMLGVTGGAAHHTQPMTAFVERKTNQIWFFTRTDTELAREMGIPVDKIVKLASNENPLGMSPNAQVWISESGPVKFVWEIAKANATHTTPNVGSTASVTFN